MKKWGNCNFSFFGKLQFSSNCFFNFSLFLFIIFYHFSSIPPLEAKMKKKDKTMINNSLKNEKTRGKLHFSIFWNIFAPLEAKMMKHDKQMIKQMIKKWKKRKNDEKNSRKIAIFHFLENCNFPRVVFIVFFVFFLSNFFLSFFISFLIFHPFHHWKQKW